MADASDGACPCGRHRLPHIPRLYACSSPHLRAPSRTLLLAQYKMVHFGRCPRVHCQGQPALPVGQSDLPRMHTTKIFCCRCEDIYYPRSSRQANVDGAYFGTTFCHLFLQTYWDLVPPPPTTTYVPRIFGFKIHRTARARLAAAAGRPAVTSNSAAAAPAAPGRRTTATAPARTAK